MIKKLKRLTIQLFAGANIVVVALLLAVGYSDHIDPEHYPLLGCVGMTFPFFLVLNFLFIGFWMVFHWRKLWIPMAGFLLAYVPINIYMPVRVMEDPPEEGLKLVSYNVHGYSGMAYGVNHFDSVFNYLLAQQADIVCLQEDNDTWRHSDTLMKKIFPHTERLDLKTGMGAWPNHIGVYTRFPIVKTERIEAPTDTKANGAVAFYLQLPEDTLLLVGCHLENVHLDKKDRDQYKEILKGEMERDNARSEGKHLIAKLSSAFPVRARQAKAIRRYIEEHRGRHPVIVCGDFNDTPISFTRYTLAKNLTDCYQASGCGLGLSYNQKGFNFRIDHILCSSELIPLHCQVDAKMGASDHYPLVCRLKMADKP